MTPSVQALSKHGRPHHHYNHLLTGLLNQGSGPGAVVSGRGRSHSWHCQGKDPGPRVPPTPSSCAHLQLPNWSVCSIPSHADPVSSFLQSPDPLQGAPWAAATGKSRMSQQTLLGVWNPLTQGPLPALPQPDYSTGSASMLVGPPWPELSPYS